MSAPVSMSVAVVSSSGSTSEELSEIPLESRALSSISGSLSVSLSVSTAS